MNEAYNIHSSIFFFDLHEIVLLISGIFWVIDRIFAIP